MSCNNLDASALGQRHIFAQFEALTGYMPAEFSRFWKFLPRLGQLEGLDDGPGEEDCPVVFATESGTPCDGDFLARPALAWLRESGVWSLPFKSRESG